MSHKTCGCEGRKAYCPFHSKITMKIMPKRGVILKNSRFHSFFKEEKKPTHEIIGNMLKRLEKDYRNQYNAIIFYDKLTNKEIYRHKP